MSGIQRGWVYGLLYIPDSSLKPVERETANLWETVREEQEKWIL
jgi:hypothetical protein